MPRLTGLLLFALLASVCFALAACGGGGEKGPQITVINQNILHGIGDEDPGDEPFDRIAERIELFAEGVRVAKPDIILMQEVLTSGEDYPDIRAIVLEALGPEYEAAFGNIIGEPIDTIGVGQMTFTRLPIVSSENHDIDGKGRSVQRITVQSAEGPIDLYNVHLNGTAFDDPQPSVDEISRVMDFIDDTRSGGPVIIAGDFNAAPDEPSIRTLLEAGYVDMLAKAGNATCDKAGDPGCTNSTVPLGDNADALADHRIDYIFVRDGEDISLEPEDAELFLNRPVDIGGGHTLWTSDHIGVKVVLRLKSK